MSEVFVRGSIAGAGDIIVVRADSNGAFTVTTTNALLPHINYVLVRGFLNLAGRFIGLNVARDGSYTLATDVQGPGAPCRVVGIADSYHDSIWLTDDGGSLDFSLGFAGTRAATIGGLPLGTPGTGALAGFTLLSGDDFNTSMSAALLRASNPLGPYSTDFSADRDRRVTSDTSYGYIWDEFHPGYANANEGVALNVNDVTVIANSVLSMKVRPMTAGEKTASALRNSGAGQREVTFGALNTFPSILHEPPFAIEFRMRFTGAASLPANTNFWPGPWLLKLAPAEAATDKEIDLEFTNNAANAFPGIIGGTPSTGSQTLNDGNWFQARMTVTANTVVFDIMNDSGTILETFTKSFSVGGAGSDPWYLLFDALATTSGFSAAAWAGQSASFHVDWWRCWYSNTSLINLTPSQPVASDILIATGGTASVTLPSKATLWGANSGSVTETLSVINAEVMAPLRSATGLTKPWGDFPDSQVGTYPAGWTWNAGTRALTIDAASAATGGVYYCYLHAKCSAPGPRRPVKFRVCVAPSVAVSDQNPFDSVPWTYQIARTSIDEGNLYPITIAVSGMPGWMSYDTATRTFSGTPPASYSGTITYTVTNVVGQQTIKTFTVTSHPAGAAYTAWSGPGWFDASDTSTYTLVNTDQVSALANKRVGSGNLAIGGTQANITQVAAIKNGLTGIRVVRDVSTQAAIPRLIAASTDTISTMFQGNDKPFTAIVAFKPTDTNSSYIWSASRRIDASGYDNISYVKRNAAASSVRKVVNSIATTLDVNFGSGEVSGTAFVLAIKCTGTAVTVWQNSTTPLISGTADNVNTMTAALKFMLFASDGNGASDPAFQTVQGNMDFYEIVIQDSAMSDAAIQQAITDIGSKWAITIS